MAEDKKPKIDLKSRLGTRSVATQGGPAVPPPVGIPKPALPGMGSRRPPPPKVDASDPYSSISASDVPAAKAEPQAIKIEMSAEVVAAQKRSRSLTYILIAVAAVVGGLLGFAFGDRSAGLKSAHAAVEGAKELVTDVDKANAVVTQLADTLKAAMESLRDNKYPDAQVKQLGEINIPFDGGTLAGKGMGRFNAKTQGMLIQYASRAQEANDAKEKLQMLLSYSKKELAGVLEQQNEETRKVQWSVYVVGGAAGPWAVMQPIETKQQFLVAKKGDTNYKWPEELKINDGGKEVPLKRYTSGDPTGNAPKIIPVDPTTHNAVCSNSTVGALSREVLRVETALRGEKDPANPGEEKQGLLELGDLLLEELRKIANAN
ncbi:MAG: hypothetical protein JW751_30255 [Polyangiaceae bacterium]|nr:hypothetical protein [Polyangiaceae bacterium]